MGTAEKKRIKRNLHPSNPLTKTGLKTPTQQDIELADNAFNKIQNIFLSHYQNALLEAANYIAKTFFNNDIELVREKKPASDKKLSFHQLCKKLQSNDPDTPSKSWLYNALGLFVAEKDLGSFHTYGELSISMKVKLLAAPKDKKEELVNEIVEKGWTVRQLQDAINKIKGKGKKVKTLQVELKGIKTVLDKKLKAINALPKDQKQMTGFQEIENALTDLIAKVDGLIGELKKTK